MCCKSFIRNSELKTEKEQQDHEDYLLIEVFVKISIWVLIAVFVNISMGVYCGYYQNDNSEKRTEKVFLNKVTLNKKCRQEQ